MTIFHKIEFILSRLNIIIVLILIASSILMILVATFYRNRRIAEAIIQFMRSFTNVGTHLMWTVLGTRLVSFIIGLIAGVW